MMIAAAVCPHPPLLLRELTGQHDVGADLRTACHDAVRSIIAHEPHIVVVIGSATPAEQDAGRGLPLSVRVGLRLLQEVGFAGPVGQIVVPTQAAVDELSRLGKTIAQRPDRIALLVMGDGSPRRSQTAPGYLDGRAVDFDTQIADALRDADPHAILRVDADLAADLMVAGLAAWQVLAATVTAQGTSIDADMLYADDPFEVMYFVSVWTCTHRQPTALARRRARSRRVRRRGS